MTKAILVTSYFLDKSDVIENGTENECNLLPVDNVPILNFCSIHKAMYTFILNNIAIGTSNNSSSVFDVS